MVNVKTTSGGRTWYCDRWLIRVRTPIGLVVSSGAGKVIHVHDVDRPDEPVYTLIGHEKTVCSLAVTPSGDIISGSWDQ